MFRLLVSPKAISPTKLQTLSKIPLFQKGVLPFSLRRHYSTNPESIDPIKEIKQNSQQQKKKKKKQKGSIQSLRRTIPNQVGNLPADFILSTTNRLTNNQKDVNFAEKSALVQNSLRPLTSITIGELIDFDKLLNVLKNNRLKYSMLVPDEVVLIRLSPSQDLMLLANGTIVGWDLTETEMMQKFVPLVTEAVVENYAPESEEMDFIDLNSLTNDYNGTSGEIDATESTSTDDGSFMSGETIIIQGQSQDQILLDKAAFAIGLSRSTRLSILENALEQHIQLTRINSEYLSKGKQITTTESDVLRLTGRLFLLRGKLNLYSELIETPDLYWTEPNLEKIYESISRTLDIQPRISILNRKLDYATEEQRALLSVLNEKKSTRLEWIIIILIMVEVGFETFHFYERYFKDETTSDKSI